MKEWQIRHKIFHQFNTGNVIGDELENEVIVEEFEKEKVIQRSLEYPTKQTKELYYPGKSYAVAIIFSKLLEVHFQEPFYESLNHEDLLYHNDPYFIPYESDKQTYDAILEHFPMDLIIQNEGCPNFKLTCEYFLKEFLIHDETRMLLPN